MTERFDADKAEDRNRERRGVYFGVAACVIWGLFPLYFMLLREVPPLVTLAFRAVFTTVLLLPIILIRGKGRAILKTLSNPLYDVGLFFTMATTAASWGMFIWLVSLNHTLYASLGNYMSPLVSVALGAIIFRDRPKLLSLIAIALAIVAVVIFAYGVGRLPWESVVVAFVFAIYSVLRKLMKVDSTSALSVETIFSLPIGVAYILYCWLAPETRPEWSTSPYYLALLVGAGVLTAIPLLLYGSAATRARLSTLGLLLYITPTGQFICGVFLFDEPTSTFQWISFILIWAALTFFSFDLWYSDKEARKQKERATSTVDASN